MNSIFDELKKINFVKILIVLIIVLVLGNFVINWLYHDGKFSSMELLEEEKENYIVMQNTIGTIEEQLNINEMCDERIAIINYCIEHEIPYQQLSIASNLEKNTLLIDFIVIILIFITYSVVNIEDESHTWKNIYILNKKNIRRIVLKKKMAQYATIFLSILGFYAIAVIFGKIMYGDWNNIKLEYINGIVVEGNYNNELINILPNFLLRSIFYTELTFCLTCILNKSKVALIIPILVFLFEKNIGDLLEIIKIDSIFPIKYLQIVKEVTANTTKQITVAIFYIIVATVIFNILSVVGIKKIKIRN